MSYFAQAALSYMLQGLFLGIGFWAPVAAYLAVRWSVSRLLDYIRGPRW